MATVMQAYKFALDPTPRQQGSLASHTGAARFAYNWGLKLVQERGRYSPPNTPSSCIWLRIGAGSSHGTSLT
jgi:transposase